MLFGTNDRHRHRLEIVQWYCHSHMAEQSAVHDVLVYIRRFARVSYGTVTQTHLTVRYAQHVDRTLLFEVSRVNLECYDRRAFACTGTILWIKLPANMRKNGSLSI